MSNPFKSLEVPFAQLSLQFIILQPINQRNLLKLELRVSPHIGSTDQEGRNECRL